MKKKKILQNNIQIQKKAEKRVLTAQIRLEEKAKNARITKIFALFMVGMIVIVSGILIGTNRNNSENVPGYIPTENTNSSPSSESTIKIQISTLTTTPKFFSHNSNGIEIRFMAMKGSDGLNHVAFDACDVCYGSKKGYRPSGDVLICNNCGKSFAINSLGNDNVAGGCWPSYLLMQQEGDYLIIQKADLEAKAYMF